MKQTIIDIYNLSDFHGAILEENKKVGLVTIATFLNKMKEEKKDSYLFLSDGDMYSGTYFSEITKGKPLTQMLNLLDLTCMGVGNHEIADKLGLSEQFIKNQLSIARKFVARKIKEDNCLSGFLLFCLFSGFKE